MAALRVEREFIQCVLSMCCCFSVAFPWASLLIFWVGLLAYSGKKSVQLLYMSQPTFLSFFSWSLVVAFSFQNSMIRLNNCPITVRNIGFSDDEEYFFLHLKETFYNVACAFCLLSCAPVWLFRYWKTPIRSPLTFLFTRLNTHNSLNLSSFIKLPALVALC